MFLIGDVIERKENVWNLGRFKVIDIEREKFKLQSLKDNSIGWANINNSHMFNVIKEEKHNRRKLKL